jgi:hypothetical protein
VSNVAARHLPEDLQFRVFADLILTTPTRLASRRCRP